MGYAEVKAIYDKTRLDIFVMAITHLMETIGFEDAREITDEDIEQVEGNGLMTKGFCQELCRLARDIANACDAPELIQLCQAEDVFETRFTAGKIGRNRLEDICINALNVLVDKVYPNYLEVGEDLGIDFDEMEMLGYDMSDYEEGE